MLEYEKKAMLTGNEYIALVMMMCKYAPVVPQTNYYFDTEDYSMNQKGITYRIRAKEGIFKTTVKIHCTDNPDCSMEEELAVQTEFKLNAFDKLGLRYQGELLTERIVMYRNSFCKMVLDRNSYLGKTDFELEVEYLDGYEDEALRLLQNIAEALVTAYMINDPEEFMIRVGKSGSKSGRFFERKLNTEKKGG